MSSGRLVLFSGESEHFFFRRKCGSENKKKILKNSNGWSNGQNHVKSSSKDPPHRACTDSPIKKILISWFPVWVLIPERWHVKDQGAQDDAPPTQEEEEKDDKDAVKAHAIAVAKRLLAKAEKIWIKMIKFLHMSQQRDPSSIGGGVPDFKPELTKRQISDGPSALLPTPQWKRTSHCAIQLALKTSPRWEKLIVVFF